MHQVDIVRLSLKPHSCLDAHGKNWIVIDICNANTNQLLKAFTIHPPLQYIHRKFVGKFHRYDTAVRKEVQQPPIGRVVAFNPIGRLLPAVAHPNELGHPVRALKCENVGLLRSDSRLERCTS